MIKGLVNKEQIQELIYPLQVLNTIVDSKAAKSGIILNIDKDLKNINIYTSNLAIGTIAFVKYSGLLDTFQLDSDKIGIINIADFIKYFSIIEDDNTELEFNNKKFYIKDGSAEISFQTADIDMIKEPNKNFTGQDWIVECEYDDKFAKLQKAMKAMVNEEYIFMKTDSQSKKLNFTVRQKDLDTNNFKWSIDADVKKDEEIIIKKDYFLNATSIKCDTLQLKLSSRLINFDCIRKNSVISIYIAKCSK